MGGGGVQVECYREKSRVKNRIKNDGLESGQTSYGAKECRMPGVMVGQVIPGRSRTSRRRRRKWRI